MPSSSGTQLAKPAIASANSTAAAQPKKGLFGWGVKKENPSVPTTITSTTAATSQSSITGSDENIPPTAQPAPVVADKALQEIPPPPPAPTIVQTSLEQREAPPQEIEEYIIEDREDSDTDDEGTTNENKPKQNIPEWAKGPSLKAALEKQYGYNGHPSVDPDSIFTEVHTCSLEEIFGQREGKAGK
jgi:hypothetical protein